MLIPGESWRFLLSEKQAYPPKTLDAEARSLQQEYERAPSDLRSKQPVVRKLDDLDRRMRTWILTLDSKYMKEQGIKLGDIKSRLEKMLFQIPVDLQKDESELVVISRTHEQPSVIIVRYQAQLYTQLEKQLPVWRYIIGETKTGSVWTVKVDSKVNFSIVMNIISILRAIGWEILEPLPKPYPVIPILLETPIQRPPYEIKVKSSQTIAPTAHLNKIFPQFVKDFMPKELTSEQIEDIVSAVPYPTSSDTKTKIKARTEIQQHLREDLKGAKLTPLGIEHVKSEIKRRYNKAVVQAGDTVGLRSADALGQPLMQMTLNSVDYQEQLLLQISNETKVVKIGEWINSLLETHKSRVQLMPENRTEYLELDQPTAILACDFDGRVAWRKISAVTRHLPVGKLIKITTLTKRTVTATRQKSFLIYSKVIKNIIAVNGTDLKVGDRVPISLSPTKDQVTL